MVKVINSLLQKKSKWMKYAGMTLATAGVILLISTFLFGWTGQGNGGLLAGFLLVTVGIIIHVCYQKWQSKY